MIYMVNMITKFSIYTDVEVKNLVIAFLLGCKAQPLRALYREGTLLKGSTFLVVPDVTGHWQRPTLYLLVCFSVPDFGTTTSAFTVKATRGLPEMGIEPAFSCVIIH